MKTTALIWPLLSILLTFSPSLYSFVIVIDPGHGGRDMGAKFNYNFAEGKKLREKDLALKVGLKLYKLLRKDYRTFLTRSVDRSLSLEERAQLLEKVQADLLISIHFNSSPSSRTRGHEIYYLDNRNNMATKRVVQNYSQTQDGEEWDVQQILNDLAIKRSVWSSKRLAASIHKKVLSKVSRKYKLKDRGIRPGPFYVLAFSRRPSILLEVGFLSNAKEAKLMINEQFHRDYAQSVASGVRAYFASVAGHAPILQLF